MCTPGLFMVSLASLWSLALAGVTPAQGLPPLGPEARVAEARTAIPIVFEGLVLAPDAAPAEGAVVVSSAGGRAVADWNGHYRLEVEVPLEAESVQVTAVGAAGANLVASTSVQLSASNGSSTVGPLRLTRGLTCQAKWLPTFGEQPGTDNEIRAMVVFDDGTGPSLFLGGEFGSAGTIDASRIAKWDGSSWSALGSGMGPGGGFNGTASVHALAVHDDGGGPALYAGGEFGSAGGVPASRIARWDGSSWSALGSGMNESGRVSALTVFDDGSGPALYAGGLFTSAGGAPAKYIAKWDGSSWSSLGTGMSGAVFALTTFDDGSGLALYAGGQFGTAGGVTASWIARWNGSSWSALPCCLGGPVYSLVAITGTGLLRGLYVGGGFVGAGRNWIARWDGSSWSALGSGMNYIVRALAVYDDGSGPALYAGGEFFTAGGVPASHVAKWDGTSWSALDDGTDAAVDVLTVYDDGSGPALHAGGAFTTAGGLAATRIAKWNGADWAAFSKGVNAGVESLTLFDDGSGEALYAGGLFTGAGVSASRIAKWDGSSWTPLGGGMSVPALPGNNVSVRALAVYDDGGGPALYAGGSFLTAGGVSVNGIAKWDGSSWTSLGNGTGGGYSYVWALTVYDDGSGPALFAGGEFETAGGVTVNYIAKWDGSSWSALGDGIWCACQPRVSALAVHDDGTGPALYVGGNFTRAGNAPAMRVARWNGSFWSPVGSGMNDPSGFAAVWCLAEFDDGSGPALYAGGDFTTAGGVGANRIAKWDGSSWSALGAGMNKTVRSLTAHDDGSGPALYASGYFTTAGGLAANRIARWDGSSWLALGSGLMGGYPLYLVGALSLLSDPTRHALYAGGSFVNAPDSGDSFLARWGCLPTVHGKTRRR